MEEEEEAVRVLLFTVQEHISEGRLQMSHFVIQTGPDQVQLSAVPTFS